MNAQDAVAIVDGRPAHEALREAVRASYNREAVMRSLKFGCLVASGIVASREAEPRFPSRGMSGTRWCEDLVLHLHGPVGAVSDARDLRNQDARPERPGRRTGSAGFGFGRGGARRRPSCARWAR